MQWVLINSYAIKSFDSIQNKIKLLNQISTANKLKLFYFDIKDKVVLSDINYNLCKTIYRTRSKNKPETIDKIINLIVLLYKI